jgi:hypothetical protein
VVISFFLFSVGWQKVQLTLVAQVVEVTALQIYIYIACCLEMAKQEFDTVGGFRNRYSMDFLTQNLLFIPTRRGSL